MKCEECKFWSRYYGSKEQGQCRRWAPEITQSVSGWGFATAIGIETEHKAEWPDTKFNEWCGEFESNITTPTAATTP